MGGACGTYGDEGKIMHDSGGENPRMQETTLKTWAWTGGYY